MERDCALGPNVQRSLENAEHKKTNSIFREPDLEISGFTSGSPVHPDFDPNA